MPAVTGTSFITAPNGVKTIKDLVAAAKKQPSTLTYGHSGVGSGTHFAGELFNSVMNVKTVHVPHKGGTEVIADAIGGRISFGIVPLAPSVPLVKTGRIHGVAITTKQRNPQLPDIPTLNESGAPGYEYIGWFAMSAPGKTAPAIIAKLGAEVTRILALPDVTQQVKAIGNEARPGTPEELHHLLRSEIETRKKIFGGQAGKTQQIDCSFVQRAGCGRRSRSKLHHTGPTAAYPLHASLVPWLCGANLRRDSRRATF